MKDLTGKQKSILRFIHAFYQENGFCPSYRDIMAAEGIKALRVMQMHLERLMAKRMITYRAGEARTVLLTTEGREAVEPQYYRLNNETGHFERMES